MRWARKDRYRSSQGCRYCSSARCGNVDCAIAVCLACHTPQCHGNGGGNGCCAICYIGLLPGWSGSDRPCSAKGCGEQAVAVGPRGSVCSAHALTTVKVSARKGQGRQTVAEYIRLRIEERAKGWELIEFDKAA